MAALFSLRIVEFPTDLHLQYVLKYMLVVSIAIIAPLIGLVIYTTRGAITHFVLRLDTQLLNSKQDELSGKTPRKHWIMKREDHDGDSSSSTTDVSGAKEVGFRRRLLFWKKKDRRGVEDAEKAVAADPSLSLG